MNRASLRHPVGRVRLCALCEAISYLVLLGIAMPLKYAADRPEAVTWVGGIHGALFVALLLMVALAWLDKKLSFGDSVKVMIASVIPLAPFFLDRWLARREVANEAEIRG